MSNPKYSKEEITRLTNEYLCSDKAKILIDKKDYQALSNHLIHLFFPYVPEKIKRELLIAYTESLKRCGV